MDLSKLSTKGKSNKGVQMPLRHPGDNSILIDETTGERITITLLGSDSDEYTEAFRRISDSRLENSIGSGLKLKLSSKQLEQEQIEMLVAVTKDWAHLKFGDTEMPFSPENAKKVYTENPWIREQANAFITNRGNFLGN